VFEQYEGNPLSTQWLALGPDAKASGGALEAGYINLDRALTFGATVGRG
jgi:hypothetical protein